MGSSHSIYSSRPKDSLSNLQWALEQELSWEEQSAQAKEELLNQQETIDPHVINRADLNGGSAFVQTEMDNSRRLLLRSHRILLVDSRGKKRSKKYIDRLESEKFSASAQAALGQSASDLFAMGAAVTVANEDTPSNAAAASSSSSSGNPFVDEPEYDMSAMEQYDFRHLASSEKKSLIAKFLFIHSLIEKTVQNAQLCYKLHVKTSRLSHYLSKNKKSLSVQHVNEHQTALERANESLTSSLANFDRARATIQWAHRDYDLSVGLFKIEKQVHRLRVASNVVHNLDPSASPAALTLQIDEMMNDLAKVKSHFYAAIHENDREAITLGFNYLDSNEQGALSVEDLQGINPRLMRLLNVTEKKPLSSNHLHSVFVGEAKKIADLVSRTKELEMKNAELDLERNDRNAQTIGKNRTMIDQLNQQTLQASDDLRELYSFFLQAFARHVFNDLNANDLRNNNRLDVTMLTQGLQALEINNQEDPLAPTNLAPTEVVNELQKQDPAQAAMEHAKQFHTPQPDVVDKEAQIFTP